MHVRCGVVCVQRLGLQHSQVIAGLVHAGQTLWLSISSAWRYLALAGMLLVLMQPCLDGHGKYDRHASTSCG